MREKAEKPAKRKLTRAERKQIEAVIRQAKGDGKAHSAQASIPYQAMYPDGVCRVTANTFSKYVTAVDHWIIFALLAFIGGNMIREAFGEEEENSRETAQFDWRHMLPLAVACSIDAFAVGVSFAFMKVNIWFSVIVISVVTGAFSTVGLYIGRVFGARWQKPAQIAGGAVLVLLGLKVLLEHLGFIAW